MLDLEDSVPLSEKASARQRAVDSVRRLEWPDKTVSCRINGVDTPFAHVDLVDLVAGAGDKINSIVVPKVDNAGDIHFVDRLLSGVESRMGIHRRIGIEASIESARGMAAIAEIARASGRITSLVFGIADYSASVGAPLISISGHGEQEDDIAAGHRWHFAMSRVVMTAKSVGIRAIDAPYGHFRDMPGLEKSARMSRHMGFDGKWAIHPDQIDTINAVFSPTKEELERARKVLAAYEQAQKEGRGAVAVDGRMVDQATIRLAEMTIVQSNK